MFFFEINFLSLSVLSRDSISSKLLSLYTFTVLLGFSL